MRFCKHIVVSLWSYVHLWLVRVMGIDMVVVRVALHGTSPSVLAADHKLPPLPVMSRQACTSLMRWTRTWQCAWWYRVAVMS